MSRDRGSAPAEQVETASGPCRADLSTTCRQCGGAMRPEHAHYRCPSCGWRDSCCDGPY
ncbi:MAG TPA: hypothetical protein VLZ77_05855 [Acidimicrobiales bacterium]|nr:hypothetical protein [Acidimicrobiales bacterium]